MASPHPVLLDDRLLIEDVLGGWSARRFARSSASVMTTAYWYYRACRALVAGGAGHLSGPVLELSTQQREATIDRLLVLPERIGLPDARVVVPEMARLARLHERLNLLNLEVAATAILYRSVVWLTAESAAGVLPAVLDAEGVRWRVVEAAP